MLETWNNWTQRQKIVFSIYALIQLPLMAFMIIMIPFAHWITQSANTPTRRITVEEYLCMSVAMSLFTYFFGALIWCSR